MPRDLSGLSIKNPRIRVVHTTDPGLEGGSMYLQQVDPWLGYQWGRSLTQRNFRERDGVYGDAGKLDGILLPDGATKMMDRSHANSCGSCHNIPYRDGGAGMTIAKNGGDGRNTPHMFGGGLVEMIGLQMRLQALAIADANRDGWISFEEEAKGKRCVLDNLPDGVDGDRVAIDFGSFDDEDGNGYPDLNPVFYPIFVDKNGQRIAFARNLKFPDVAGYTFEVQVFGFGHLYMPFRPPVSTTLRAFTPTPFDIHSGLQAYDPTTLHQPQRRRPGPGLQRRRPAVRHRGRQGPRRRARPTKTGLPGISLDDPDRDGYCEEITEGDLDVAEWYLLNHPAPARGQITTRRRRRREAVPQDRLRHLPRPRLAPARRTTPTPRTTRSASTATAASSTCRSPSTTRPSAWKASSVYLADKARTKATLAAAARRLHGPRHLQRLQVSRRRRGLLPDAVRRQRRPQVADARRCGASATPRPTATTAPASTSTASSAGTAARRWHRAQAYTELTDAGTQAGRRASCNSLVLYQTDQLPCDINGDGKIDEHFMVQGMDTGLERFNPEWLFRSPARSKARSATSAARRSSRSR